MWNILFRFYCVVEGLKQKTTLHFVLHSFCMPIKRSKLFQTVTKNGQQKPKAT